MIQSSLRKGLNNSHRRQNSAGEDRSSQANGRRGNQGEGFSLQTRYLPCRQAERPEYESFVIDEINAATRL